MKKSLKRISGKKRRTLKEKKIWKAREGSR
jgi:hypothetical protein